MMEAFLPSPLAQHVQPRFLPWRIAAPRLSGDGQSPSHGAHLTKRAGHQGERSQTAMGKLNVLAGALAFAGAAASRHGRLKKPARSAKTARRCGVLAILRTRMPENELRALGLKLSKRLRHRGPDWNGLHIQRHDDGTLSLLAHERLAIVDPASGKQPLFDATGKVCATVNGEIYNHMQLREDLGQDIVSTFQSQSDCAPLPDLFKQKGENLAESIDGIFSLVISEEGSGDFYVARDPIGVTPLYYGTGHGGELFVASELKALHDCCPNFSIFPPGHYLSSASASKDLQPVRYFNPSWWHGPCSHSPAADGPSPVAADWAEKADSDSGLDALRLAFEKAVDKRLMADVPYGVLLSGGLDSSLVSAVAIRKHRDRILKRKGSSLNISTADGLITISLKALNTPGLLARVSDVITTLGFVMQTATSSLDNETATASLTFKVLWSEGPGLTEADALRQLEYRLREELRRISSAVEEKNAILTDALHSFSVGLEGAPDLMAARKVANHLGTVHHEFTFTVQEGIDAVRDVIYHLETHDVTTIRASVPMYFLTRKIKAMGIKMVLSGEGADEVFGGYLYFHKAPNGEEFHEELKRKLDALHMYDCLRANKSTHSFGLEARVPFLDKSFLEVAMNIDPRIKMPRENERNIEKWPLRQAFEGYLPDEILWRQKEQFSDGVGYSWIDGLKEFAERKISDEQMAAAPFRFPVDPPLTKEAYYYREVFTENFPEQSAKATVPGGPSIACSTPAAIAWDESFKNNADQSGRSVLGVHNDGKQFEDAKKDQVSA